MNALEIQSIEMASNDCDTQTICDNDVKSFYNELLNEIEKNLEELTQLNEESSHKQTWGEWWCADWTVQPVNFDRVKCSLNKLKQEIESGKELYKKIFKVLEDISSKQSDFDKNFKNRETQERDNLQFSIHLEQFVSSFHSDRVKLSKTFSELKLKVNEQETQAISDVVSKQDERNWSMFGSLGSRVLNLSCNKAYKQGDSKEGQILQKEEPRYNKLLKNKVLNKLQCHHFTILQILNGLKLHQKDLDAFLQNHHTMQDVDVISDKNVVAKASRIYYETESDELDELKSAEPDMSEEKRKGIATRAAVRSCKNFFKKLNYSDSQVDEFIKEIQT